MGKGKSKADESDVRTQWKDPKELKAIVICLLLKS